MSSPMAINRPASPAEPSSSVSSSVSRSVASTSSRSSAPLFYTRDELLALATSPLSQTPPPAAIAAFPMIMRKTRRGVVEAYQTLDYARSTSGTTAPPTPAPARGGSLSSNARHLTRSSSPRAWETDLPTQLPPPMWNVDVYVPPARRVEQEQRFRPGRDPRSYRTWRRPVQARSQTQSRW